MTTKAFSENTLVEKLESKWPDAPATGFKVGMAMGSVLVKRIGKPRSPHQALVWPGRAVNYAVKAAQSGDVKELIVTGFIWDTLEKNDYIAFSCGCTSAGVPQHTLWHNKTIEVLDRSDPDGAEGV